MSGVICAEKILIDQIRYPNLEEMTPKELFCLPNGAIGDRPSFAVAMTNSRISRSVVGQFSLETLKSALNEVGFDIIPLQ